MHSLLSKLLQKRGIENIEDLSKEEKTWFDEKQRVLSQNDEISLEDFRKFCQTQIDLIEGQWKNLDNSKEKNERLIGLFTVYSTLKKIIAAPKGERELLEDYLTQLLK